MNAYTLATAWDNHFAFCVFGIFVGVFSSKCNLFLGFEEVTEILETSTQTICIFVLLNKAFCEVAENDFAQV